jgi:formate dehydrogenase maturation protein FdhE
MNHPFDKDLFEDEPIAQCPICASTDLLLVVENGDEGDDPYCYYRCEVCDNEFDQDEVE